MGGARGCGAAGGSADGLAGDGFPAGPPPDLESALPWPSGAMSLTSEGDADAPIGGADAGVVVASYTAGDSAIADSAEYNIEIDFAGTSWTEALQAAFIAAADYLVTFIVGDVPDALVRSGGGSHRVDDMRIDATLAEIDGPGGVLGQAGPTALRIGSFLPAEASMTFDAADAEALLATGQWSSVILHEMMHSLGLGTIWNLAGLVSQPASGEAYYMGANGSAWFSLLYPELAAVTGGRVPVETDGGAGTAFAHWDEDAFGPELMTGYLNGGTENSLSNLSIGSLADLGYRLTGEYMLA